MGKDKENNGATYDFNGATYDSEGQESSVAESMPSYKLDFTAIGLRQVREAISEEQLQEHVSEGGNEERISEGRNEERVNKAGNEERASEGKKEEEIKYEYEPGVESGGKTIEDYYALPEDRRVELIDGVFYDMSAPSSIHQFLTIKLAFSLSNYVANNNGKCLPFTAPIDVQLFGDDKTMVQPDVLVTRDRNKIVRRGLVGAPDLVIEILSPYNRKKDLILKRRKYQEAGVREYWIVFPEEKKVWVYLFEKGDEPREYTFADKVPVGIWDGKCEVDFAKVYEEASFLYDL